MASESVGSIRNQLGRIMVEITDAVRIGDLERHADLLHLMVTRAAPLLSPQQEEELAVPLEAPTTREEARALFLKLSTLERKLLRFCADKNVYAYSAPEVGDATDMALKDDDGAGVNVPVRA